jgi:hypothetical protein
VGGAGLESRRSEVAFGSARTILVLGLVAHAMSAAFWILGLISEAGITSDMSLPRFFGPGFLTALGISLGGALGVYGCVRWIAGSRAAAACAAGIGMLAAVGSAWIAFLSLFVIRFPNENSLTPRLLEPPSSPISGWWLLRCGCAGCGNGRVIGKTPLRRGEEIRRGRRGEPPWPYRQTAQVEQDDVWLAPLSEDEVIGAAAEMAGRWQWNFLRALRDLRRYTPVVNIQTAGQVNVGGQ